MNWKRLVRHLFTDHQSVARAFPPEAMKAIEKAIGEEEQRHGGNCASRSKPRCRFPISRTTAAPASAQSAASAARPFGAPGTHAGGRTSPLLADRRVELVADRGIHSKVGTAAWEAICGEMQQEFARGQFERGVVIGVRAVSDLLAEHFPPSGEGRNELPDRPVVL